LHNESLCVGFAYTHRNGYSNGDGDGDGNRYRYGNRNANAYSNANTYRNAAEGYAHTAATTNSGASANAISLDLRAAFFGNSLTQFASSRKAASSFQRAPS